jgi:hypothetical protein
VVQLLLAVRHLLQSHRTLGPLAQSPNQNSGLSGGNNAAGHSAFTVINGQTFTPVANTPSPAPLVFGGSTFAPITAVAGAAPVFNIGGQTLGIGSTIILGLGAAAETIALQTNGQGNIVLIAGSSTSTLSSSSLGGYIASGLGGSKTSSGGVAQQTTNAASQADGSQTLSIVLVMVMVLTLK